MAPTVLLALDADSAGRKRCCARRRSRPGANWSCASCRSRRAPTRRSWSSAREPWRSRHDRGVRSVRALPRGGVLAAATTAAPRAATRCWTSCGPCSRRCRPARCGWSSRAWSPSASTCRRASPSGPWRRAEAPLRRTRDPPPRRVVAGRARRALRSYRVARAPSGLSLLCASSSPSRASRRSRSWTPPSTSPATAAPRRRAPARASRQPRGWPPEEDPELAALLAELVVQAGRESPRPGMLESQRMQLELARLDRRIRAARAQGSGEVSDLARRRAEVKRAFERAYEQALAETGG